MQEATALGLEVTDDPRDSAYAAGERVCVTNVVNGHGLFAEIEPGFTRLPRPCRQGRRIVMRCQILIGSVDAGLIAAGRRHAGSEFIADDGVGTPPSAANALA